ncbi:hypothetical protein EI555_010875, partial [Monodon monoceros]
TKKSEINVEDQSLGLTDEAVNFTLRDFIGKQKFPKYLELRNTALHMRSQVTEDTLTLRPTVKKLIVKQVENWKTVLQENGKWDGCDSMIRPGPTETIFTVETAKTCLIPYLPSQYLKSTGYSDLSEHLMKNLTNIDLCQCTLGSLLNSYQWPEKVTYLNLSSVKLYNLTLNVSQTLGILDVSNIVFYFVTS